MKTLRSVFLALTIFVSTAAFGGEKAAFVKKLEAGQNQTIVTYGTSLTAGGAWVKQLGTELDTRFAKRATIINSAKSGMWSKWGVDNLDERVLAKKPDTVIIEFAINDAFLKYATSKEQAQQNWENMIERIQKANPATEIILMTMNPTIGDHLKQRPNLEEYYNMVRELAKKHGFLLIDHEPSWQKVLKEGEAEFKKLAPDGLHPNPEGCQKIILPQMLESLGLAKWAPRSGGN